MILPLVPLGLELLLTNSLSDETVTLAASMYAILIGTSSRHKLMLGAAMIVCIVFTAVYGSVTVQKQQQQAHVRDVLAGKAKADPPPSDPKDTHSAHIEGEPAGAKNYQVWSLWAIAMVFAVHLGERFIRHVLNSEPFWELN
jgi:hypothetical protein